MSVVYNQAVAIVYKGLYQLKVAVTRKLQNTIYGLSNLVVHIEICMHRFCYIVEQVLYYHHSNIDITFIRKDIASNKYNIAINYLAYQITQNVSRYIAQD